MKKLSLLSLVGLCLLIPAVLGASKVPARQPRIDLVFCVDTTGSMGDEIEVVKDRMKDMIAKIADGTPTPKVRVGIVAYRDRGDEYVVKKTLLTEDLDAAVKSVTELQAAGGGDKEESVNEALHVALQDLNWDRTPQITRLVYLIGDAGPNQYPGDFDPETDRKKAIADGIIINAIGCSGITETEVAFFKKMAQGTEGTFANLTYREEYAKADGSRTVILKEGEKVYAYEPSASGPAGPGADWREGAEKATTVGTARPAAAADMSMASRPAAGTVVRSKDGWQINASMMNNLDTVMTRQAQTLAAKQQGIKYDTSDLVPFLRELQGHKTGIKKSTRLLVKDEKAWKSLWAEHQSYQKAVEPLPKVDFTKEMVLVIASPLSEKKSAILREAAETKDKIVVEYTVSHIPKGGERSAYHFAVIKKNKLPVSWKSGSK